jgi:hypothetical protein
MGDFREEDAKKHHEFADQLCLSCHHPSQKERGEVERSVRTAFCQVWKSLMLESQ